MPVIKDTCTCEEALDHSYVINSRYRWNKTYQEYQKRRRRQCLECNGRFSTIEINRKQFQNLLQKAKELEDIKIKAEKIKELRDTKTKAIQNKFEIKIETKKLTGQKNLSTQKTNFDNLINNL